MTRNQDTGEKAPRAKSSTLRHSVTHPSDHLFSVMALAETREIQSMSDTSHSSDKPPSPQKQRAKQARQCATQTKKHIQKLDKYSRKAQKYTQKAEKHSDKAEKYACKAKGRKAIEKVFKFTQKSKEHAETASKYADKAQKYTLKLQDSGLQDDQQPAPKKRNRKRKSRQRCTSQESSSVNRSSATNLQSQGKRAREEVDVVDNQPQAKKQRSIKSLNSSIPENSPEEVQDESVVMKCSKGKRGCQEEGDDEEAENHPSAKRARRLSPVSAATNNSTLAPILERPAKAPVALEVPVAWREHLDYIKASASAKLRSMELELKRRLREQEDEEYSMFHNTNIPEYRKEVTSALLQRIQTELKTRIDAAPPTTSKTRPRSFSRITDAVPNALKTLYEKYRSQDLTTFTCFRELPTELRIMIWEQVEDPRIVKLEMIRAANGTSGLIISKTEQAAIFLTCHESRGVALKIYKPLPLPFNLRLTVPIPILVNYECDTILHDKSLFRDAELFKDKNVKRTTRPIIKVDRLICDLPKVRSLAFDAYIPQQKDIPSLGADINCCEVLENLTLVLGETYSAHLIEKGKHCPIIKGLSYLNRLSKPPLSYGIKRLKDRSYMVWNVDANRLGAQGSVRGQFREIVSKERERETGAIKLLEAFHEQFHKLKKYWEEGPKRKPYPEMCKCHIRQHEKIMTFGTSTWEPNTNREGLGDITPEAIIAAIPVGGITRAELVKKLKIRLYSIDAQLEFHVLTEKVLFKCEDEKLRPKKDGPIDVTPETFVAAIPLCGILKCHLYSESHVPPDEAPQRSKWQKRAHRTVPIFPQFSTYSAAAKKEFLDLVDTKLYLAADGKMRLRENAPLDLSSVDVLNAVPPEGITTQELYAKFNITTYSVKARREFSDLIETTLLLGSDQKLYPKEIPEPEPCIRGSYKLQYFLPAGHIFVNQPPTGSFITYGPGTPAAHIPPYVPQVTAALPPRATGPTVEPLANTTNSSI